VGAALTLSGTTALILLGKKREDAGPHRSTGIALALAASLAWGLNTFASRQGGTGFHPAFANVVRMSFAFVMCTTLLRLRKAGPWTLAKDEYRRYLPFFAIEAVGGSFTYLYGLAHSAPAVGATLSSLSPLFALPVAAWRGLERITWAKALAVLVLMSGVIVLVVT
jgi:drug/metabolite transporter (DMT)-like permease